MKLNIESIVKDPDIYSCIDENPGPVEAYAEALKAGAEFPPILVQRISDDGKGSTVFLDGVHRAKACEEAGGKEIEAEYWREETLDKKEWLTRLQTPTKDRAFVIDTSG